MIHDLMISDSGVGEPMGVVLLVRSISGDGCQCSRSGRGRGCRCSVVFFFPCCAARFAADTAGMPPSSEPCHSLQPLPPSTVLLFFSFLTSPFGWFSHSLQRISLRRLSWALHLKSCTHLGPPSLSFIQLAFVIMSLLELLFNLAFLIAFELCGYFPLSHNSWRANTYPLQFIFPNLLLLSHLTWNKMKYETNSLIDFRAEI